MRQYRRTIIIAALGAVACGLVMAVLFAFRARPVPVIPAAQVGCAGGAGQVCSGTISRTKSAVNRSGSTGAQLGLTTNLVSPAAT
jgi:hypothetical protein